MRYILILTLIIGAVAVRYYLNAFSLIDGLIILACGLIGGFLGGKVTEYFTNKSTRRVEEGLRYLMYAKGLGFTV